MLAHKATAEGHVAAEVIAGHAAAFEPRGIPSVAYTDPEVAWVGLTETEAAEQSIAYEKSVFPWSASGRALAIDGADGLDQAPARSARPGASSAPASSARTPAT